MEIEPLFGKYIMYS